MSASTLQAATANDKPVIATRCRRPFRVVAHGLRYFWAQLPGLLASDEWDIRDRSTHTPSQLLHLANDLRGCDLAFSWGGRIDMGRFLWGARTLGARKVAIFWCGSDVLRAQKIRETREPDPWIAGRIHWAASPSLAEEVCSLGLRCEYVQSSFVEQIAQPKPLPHEFSVLVFLPRPDLADLYGWDRIVEVAVSLPHLQFNLVGLREGSVDAPPNVRVHRWISDLTPMLEQTTVLWRPVRHDAGIAFMVLEAMAHGRHVLYTYPVSGAVQVRESRDAREQLSHMYELHQAGLLGLNHSGRENVACTYRREVVREELHRRWQEIILS